MRVAVDARQVYRANRRGIGKALRLMLQHLAVLPQFEFPLFYQTEPAENPFPERPTSLLPRRIDIPGDRFGLWEQVRLPVAAWRAGADLLYCPANTGPRYPGRPMVLTVYDLIPLVYDAQNPRTKVWGQAVARAARAAQKVHTASAYTASQLHSVLGVPHQKIELIPIAADPQFVPVTDDDTIAAIRRQYGVPDGQPFVLGFAASDPRKNTRRVLEAWALLPVAFRERYFLLLVGVQDSAMPGFQQLATELLPHGGWRLHGYAAEAQLPALLTAAELLCYPSLAEGFGLPVLEAFGCGTAVLTSNTTSLPEVAGTAAILVDPEDPRAIAQGLRDALGSDAVRAEFARAGHLRAQGFTWPIVAEQVAELFARVGR